MRITYSYGYSTSTCPQDLKTALLEIASIYYRKTGTSPAEGIKSESVDGDSISYKDVADGISFTSMSIINKYKIYGFSA